MNEGKRPGGLTALAVINFIFAGVGFLSVLSMGAMIALFSASASSGIMKNASTEAYKALGDAGITKPTILIIVMAFSAISSVILLVSGIGYLKQKKLLGRMLGNLGALLSLLIAVVSAFMIPARAGGGFSLGFIFNIIYPLLTLILLNITFKEDFIY
jgi:hypothetical protein